MVFSITVSFLPRKLSKTYLGLKLKALLSTRSPLELGKVYRYMTLIMALLVLSALDVPFLVFCVRFVIADRTLGEDPTKEEVRVCKERSDELSMRAYLISTYEPSRSEATMLHEQLLLFDSLRSSLYLISTYEPARREATMLNEEQQL